MDNDVLGLPPHHLFFTMTTALAYGSAMMANIGEEFQLAFASYGKLLWMFSTLSKRIDFLDIMLKIDVTGSIDTTLFEKGLNLYLYLPPHSAHPPGGLKGLIFGWFFRLQCLVSNPALCLTLAGKLRLRLLAWGYTPEQLNLLFCEACSKCFSGIPKKFDASGINPLYLHMNFHQADPSARVKPKNTFFHHKGTSQFMHFETIKALNSE
jgi:hypothetical protein